MLPGRMKKRNSVRSTPKRRKKALRIQNILVPIDFSEMSIRAIAGAKLLARRFGSRVHLANIHESSYPAGFLELGSPFAFLPLTYLEDTREAARKRLQDLAGEHGLPEPVRLKLADHPMRNSVISRERYGPI